MSSHRPGQYFIVTIAALTVLVVLGVWWRPWGRPRLPGHSLSTIQPPEARDAKSAIRATREAQPLLSRAVQELKEAQGAEGARQIFARLQAELRSLTPAVAAARIVELLDSKVDAPSHLEFAVGPDGYLKQPSSLRVFLLDELAKIDPSAAAAYAEKILASKDSPDEWAISLRNYALGRSHAEALPFLRQKVREMIRDETWQKAPSVGFLEAFDVAVFAGGTDLMPDLTELLRQKENQAVAHASYLSLDRLVIREPVATLEQLQRQPELMEGREATRANYFARANVSDPAQRAVLESYLLDPRHNTAELQTFAGVFPSGNFMISHNLLTRCTTPTGDVLATQDRAALQVVEGWLNDPRFARVEATLREIRKRLQRFVAPGDGSAPPPR